MKSGKIHRTTMTFGSGGGTRSEQRRSSLSLVTTVATMMDRLDT